MQLYHDAHDGAFGLAACAEAFPLLDEAFDESATPEWQEDLDFTPEDGADSDAL
jgi:hypothetical protein